MERFWAEAFPEDGPNAIKLVNKDGPHAGGLRIDFVGMREDGSYLRLHPGRHHDDQIKPISPQLVTRAMAG